MHTLLDQCGEHLRDAWFLDFEMVGRGALVYAAYHGGFSYLSGYTPDAETSPQTAMIAHQDAEIWQDLCGSASLPKSLSGGRVPGEPFGRLR